MQMGQNANADQSDPGLTLDRLYEYLMSDIRLFRYFMRLKDDNDGNTFQMKIFIA